MIEPHTVDYVTSLLLNLEHKRNIQLYGLEVISHSWLLCRNYFTGLMIKLTL
jgi:hypothetical protein